MNDGRGSTPARPSLLDADEALMLDMAVPGAVRILANRVAERFGEAPRARTIIAYHT